MWNPARRSRSALALATAAAVAFLGSAVMLKAGSAVAPGVLTPGVFSSASMTRSFTPYVFCLEGRPGSALIVARAQACSSGFGRGCFAVTTCMNASTST